MIVFFKPAPTRLVPSGRLAMAPLTNKTYEGTRQQQARRNIIITNLHNTAWLTLRTPSGSEFASIPPLQPIQIETDADINIANKSAVETINYQVAEWFYTSGGTGLTLAEDLASQAPSSSPAAPSSPAPSSSGAFGGRFGRRT